MDYFVLRTFDHAAYYETRVILMVISLAIVGYFLYYKRDRRFLLMFASGVLFHALMEYALQQQGLRGANYSFSVFGRRLPGLVGPLFQGLVEGGIVSIFAFWFADLRAARPKSREWWPFYGLCALVMGLALIVGFVARGQQPTSVRPMSVPPSTFIVAAIIFISLFIAWRKDDLPALANFYGGLLLYALLTFETLHILGARYIGAPAGNQIVAATMPMQIVMMLLSHVFEFAGGKLHYFMLPFALGLIALRERDISRSHERYSTQHMQDLVTRGWRKRSKFTQDK
jgi:hypothetical protein